MSGFGRHFFSSFGFPLPGGFPRFEDFAQQQTQHHQNNQQENKKIPPASNKAINLIPKVKVTADDIQEESNKECMICLDEHSVGDTASKIPCGHIFHKECIEEWLRKKCICPICHFEIETDDTEYEKERINRMRLRKPRYRRDELEKKSVSQLRDIARTLSIRISDCVDKRDIVDRFISSDKLQIVEMSPPIEITQSKLNQLSVSQLKHHLLSFGLSTTGALEKQELVQRLLESGRVIIIPDASDTPSPSSSTDPTHCSLSSSSRTINSSDNSNISPSYSSPISHQSTTPVTVLPTPPSPSSSSSSSWPSAAGGTGGAGATPTGGNTAALVSIPSESESTPMSNSSDPSHSSSPAAPDKFEIHEASLKSMSIKDLRCLMKTLNVSWTGCVEREDLIFKISQANNITIRRAET